MTYQVAVESRRRTTSCLQRRSEHLHIGGIGGCRIFTASRGKGHERVHEGDAEVEDRLCTPGEDTTNIDAETLASTLANKHISSCRLTSKCGQIPVNRDVFTVNVSTRTVDARVLLVMSKCIGADGERESHRSCASDPHALTRCKVEEKHSWPPSGNVSGEEKVPTKKMKIEPSSLSRYCVR